MLPPRIIKAIIAVQNDSLDIDNSIDYSAIHLLARPPPATVLRRGFSSPSPQPPPETYSERWSRLLPVASELWRERPPDPRVDDSCLEDGGSWSRSQSGVCRSSRYLWVGDVSIVPV